MDLDLLGSEENSASVTGRPRADETADLVVPGVGDVLDGPASSGSNAPASPVFPPPTPEATQYTLWNYMGPVNSIPQPRTIVQNLKFAGVDGAAESEVEIISTSATSGYCEGNRGNTAQQVQLHLTAPDYPETVKRGNLAHHQGDLSKVVHVLSTNNESSVCLCTFLYLISRKMTEGGVVTFGGTDKIHVSSARGDKTLTFKQAIRGKDIFQRAKSVYNVLSHRGKQLMSYIGGKNGVDRMAWN